MAFDAERLEQQAFRLEPRLFGAFSVLCCLPLWLVHRPPLQDLPQHLAAVRVLLDHDDPSFGMVGAVELTLSRTQYLAFYVAALVVAKLTGPLFASKLLLSVSLAATPMSVRALLASTDRDVRLAWLALPLTYNAHVLLGFVNFVAAIPLCLLAIALAARDRDAFSMRRAVLLAALLALIFYMHVVPFAVASAFAAAFAIGPSLRVSLKNLAALVPALVAAVHWALASPAGDSTLQALLSLLEHESTRLTRYDPLAKTLREWPEWLIDVLPGEVDRMLLAAWGVCALLVSFVRARFEGSPRPSASRALALLSPACAVASFVLPYQHDWIWPIAGRFPYLCALCLPLSLPRMKSRAGFLITAILLALAVGHVGTNAVRFVRYEQQEALGFEGALAALPRGARVVGLMYDRDSAFVGEHPFMHFVAHAQAEHGGVVAFSFGEGKQSPFTYQGPHAPPPLRLGFGWAPHAGNVRVMASYFKYALVRGEHPHLQQVARFYERVYARDAWSLWKRK